MRRIATGIGGLLGSLALALPAAAEEVAATKSTDFGQIGWWVLQTLIFGLVGIVVLIGAYYLWEMLTPYSVKEQLVKEKNLAVAIVVAAFILGTAIVIAAALSPG